MDGKNYTLPYYFGSRYMFYRKDVWAAAGLEVPTTLSEFSAAAAKLKTDTPGVELFPVPAFTDELGGGRTEEVQFVGVRIPPQVLSAKKVIGIGFH